MTTLTQERLATSGLALDLDLEIPAELCVVVTTHNRADIIDQTLHSLAQQTWDNGTWTILLVDNDSTDNTPQILRDWAPKMPVPTRILTATNGHSPAYARNAAAAETTTPNIAFIDDDDLIAPGWVAAIGTALRTHQLVGSRYDYHHLNDPHIASHRGSFQTRQLDQFFGAPIVSGGGAGCRRELWDELGGHSEALGYGGEDIDFALRANLAGVTPAMCDNAVYHVRLRESARSAFTQGRLFARSHAHLHALHGAAFGAEKEPAIRVLRRWLGLAYRSPSIRSPESRLLWAWQLGRQLGHLHGSLNPRHQAVSTSPRDAGISLWGPDEMEDSVPTELCVVVTTHNRADIIDQTLHSLAQQTWDNGTWTILLVDNDSTDNTPQILRDWAPKMPVPTRIATATERHNPSYARNTAADHTTATNLAFIDDDDLIAPGWVAAIGTALRTHQLVGSRYDYRHLNDPHVVRHRSFQSDELGLFNDARIVSGGGMGCRRQLWHDVGGSNEDFRTGQDIDFALRVARLRTVEPILCTGAEYHVRLRGGARDAFRQGQRFGKAFVRLHSVHGSPSQAARSSARPRSRRWLTLALGMKQLRSEGHRLSWAFDVGHEIGLIRGSLAYRTWSA